MAIIARFNTQLERLRLALTKMDIPIEPLDRASRADAVRLLPMHSSKGREFNAVVIPDLGCMPYAKVPAHAEARLLHVALTRSTERQLLTCHSESPFTQKIERLRVQSKS